MNKSKLLNLKSLLIRFLIPFLVLIAACVVYFLIKFHLNLFALAGLLLGAACFALAYIIFAYAYQKMQYIWAIFNLCIGIWGAGTFLVGISKDVDTALLAWKAAYVGVLLLPVFFYHMIHVFCDLKDHKYLVFVYAQVICVLLINIFTDQFIGRLEFIFNSFYYHRVTPTYLFFFIIWVFIVINSFYRLYKFFQRAEGLKRMQALYLFWGMLLGFAGGTTVVAPAFGIHIYPYGHFFICIYAGICTYAIFKYQLLDIRLAVTRLGVFVFVYSIVLGIPFGLTLWKKSSLVNLMGENWFWVPMFTLLVLATAGPFIYLYLQRRAEEKILQEENRIKRVLTTTSAGINVVKDLGRLFKIILEVLIKNLHLDHAAIYLFDQNENRFILKIAEPQNGARGFLNNDGPLIAKFKKKKYPILYEEMTYLSQNEDAEAEDARNIVPRMQELSAAVIVPMLRDKELLGFICLGEREEKKSYSKALTDNLLIVANEVALCIENAKFFDDIKSTQEQLFQAEKMATIGTMADGLSHQINNRFHALGFIAGDAIDTIHLNQNEPMSEKIKGIMSQLERAFTRVQDNVVQGGEIVQGLLKYTRKGEAGFTAIDIDGVLKASLEMTQFKIKTNELKVVRDFDPATVPKIRGNFTQLQEVFFNLIDNGYDAMMQRKNEKKEPGYQATLKVSVNKENADVWIIFEDNGMGVKPEDMRKLFTPFFTTKLSSKKGTGLGLYVIKKIVEESHGGKVEMVSKYMEGTQMKLCLPIAIA